MLTFAGALWNLLLAGIPFGLIWILEKRFGQKKWRALDVRQQFLVILGLGLFVFLFPNIPYLFTDSRHILDHCTGKDFYKRCPEAAWGILLYFTYAAVAIPVFVTSVQKMATLLGSLFSSFWKKATPLLLIPLAAFGVCLGLFERFNSWDILSNPKDILQDAFSYFLVSEKLLIWTIFTACFFFLFYFFRLFLSKKN